MTYYEVITEDGEILGSFADFAEASKYKQSIDEMRMPYKCSSIRWWSGSFYILNVTRSQDADLLQN